MLHVSSGVTLSLRDVRRTFEQQRVLSVPDTLDIVHAAQELLTQEPNLVEVQGDTVFGTLKAKVWLALYARARNRCSRVRLCSLW